MPLKTCPVAWMPSLKYRNGALVLNACSYIIGMARKIRFVAALPPFTNPPHSHHLNVPCRAKSCRKSTLVIDFVTAGKRGQSLLLCQFIPVASPQVVCHRPYKHNLQLQSLLLDKSWASDLPLPFFASIPHPKLQTLNPKLNKFCCFSHRN